MPPMGATNDWMTRLSIPLPPWEAALALACVGVAAMAGHFAARWLGPETERWFRARLGEREDMVGRRIPAMIRYATGALILAIVLALVGLSAIGLSATAMLVVATGLGGALGLFLFTLLRAAGVPVAVGVVLAFGIFVSIVASSQGGLDPLTRGLDSAGVTVGARRVSLLGLSSFVLVAAILFTATRIANRLMTHAVGRLTALDLSQRVLVQKIGSLAVVVAAILLGIDVLGIDFTTLTVFSGALGLAVGFGLQKTFGNLIAGLILLMDKSVKPGDVVAVGTTFGAINKIGVRAVSVITRDGKEHLIPNEQLMTQPVENWSFSSREVRIHIPVVISYASDLALAQKLMIQAATASRRVLNTPSPTVWLLAFGDRGLEHDIMVWIIDPEQGVGNVQSDILNRLWVLFREHGIGLPYPQRDLHISHGLPYDPGANLRERETKRDELGDR